MAFKNARQRKAVMAKLKGRSGFIRFNQWENFLKEFRKTQGKEDLLPKEKRESFSDKLDPIFHNTRRKIFSGVLTKIKVDEKKLRNISNRGISRLRIINKKADKLIRLKEQRKKF